MKERKRQNYQKYYSVKALNLFLEEAFEVAFGDNAINREFTMKEVINQLKYFAEKSAEKEELG